MSNALQSIDMNINQGEIWEVEFFPNVGSEIGKKDLHLLLAVMELEDYL